MIVSEDKITNGNRIVEGAYAQDAELTEIIIPEGIEDIGEVAFFGCTKLRRVVLPESLRIIREEAFGESGLESITVPERTEMIVEKAFFSCPDLKRIDVLGKNTVIGTDAFGDCGSLLEGYVACGYPKEYYHPEELLYTLLWCTCPGLHSEETCEHAVRYIRENESLIMEKILKKNNTAAMTGISGLKLLRQGNINKYVAMAADSGRTELIALLLAASDSSSNNGGEFDL